MSHIMYYKYDTSLYEQQSNITLPKRNNIKRQLTDEITLHCVSKKHAVAFLQ